MSEVITLSGLGFVLGCRHALDWDHFAAISDFIGVEDKPRRSLLLSVNYILGHGAIIFGLGLGAVLFGQVLPEWVDELMERVVGATLIILGLWLCLTFAQNPGGNVAISRGKLITNIVRRMWWRLSGGSNLSDERPVVGLKEACGIGVLHGIGGETATQVMLFTAAAGAGTIGLSLTVVVSFIAGLMISQVIIAGALILGLVKAMNNTKLYRVLLLCTVIYSIVLGALLLTGKSGALNIFGS